MHARSRRDFFLQALGLAALRAARARARSQTAPADLFDIEKVADGVYAAISRPVALINCNAAIFELAGGLLIVDTHSKPSAAAALAAQLRTLTSKPIRYIVNTHFHWDHIQGAPAYRRIAPDAELVSSTTTRDLISEFAATRLKAELEELPKEIERYRQSLASATTAGEKAYYRKMISESQAYQGEMRAWSPELPGLTFDRELILHDKANELRLAFRGRGHTAGDVVVFCPGRKVLASGDLLHGFLPYMGDGYPRDWPRTLQSVAGFDFEHVIGGHGAVQHTRERLGQMAAYIEEVAAAVARGKRQGATLDELQKGITPAVLKSLSGAYGTFVADQSRRYDAGLMRLSAAEVLARGVKQNVADTFQTLERAQDPVAKVSQPAWPQRFHRHSAALIRPKLTLATGC